MLLAFKISGIGLLPIFLVLTGFVFLWTMVVYNSLKNRKSTIEHQLHTIGQLVFQRMNFLTQLQDVLKTHLQTGTEGYDETHLAKETELVEDRIQALGMDKDTQVQQFRQELAQNASRIVKAQSKVRSLRTHYNELCTHMPYRLVANVFGFKPMHL